MIVSFESWVYFDFKADDGGGVVAGWIKTLDGEVQAQIDLKLLHWQKVQTWPDKWIKAYETLDEIFELRFKWKRTPYRILGSYGPGRWQFTMLSGGEEQRNKLPAAVREAAKDRLRRLRAEGENRRHEFKFGNKS